MTALADIRKSMLAVATLKGSDLAQFNEEHPRDERGRFAAVAVEPASVDPRAQRLARKGRRLRRIRRSVAGAQVQAAQEAAQADSRSLQALHRERPARTHQAQHQAQRQQQRPSQAQEEQQKTKPALDDSAYMQIPADAVMRTEASLSFINILQAMDFLSTGSLVVGAANERWETEMASLPNGYATLPENTVASGIVALRMSNPHYVENSQAGYDDGLMSAEQMLIPRDVTRKSGGVGFAPDTLKFTLQDGRYVQDPNGGFEVRVIDVDAWNGQDLQTYQVPPPRSDPGLHLNTFQFQEKKTFKKADETWEEEEHPRDPKSGRFKALAREAPPATVDPRIARAQRAKRRRRLIARAQAAQAVEKPTQARQVRDVRAGRERVVTRRTDPRTHRNVRVVEERAPSAATPPPSGRPKWGSGAYVEGGVRYVPGAASEALEDIGSPTLSQIKRIRRVYDPIELDPVTGQAVFWDLEAPIEMINPKVRSAFLRARKEAGLTP